MVKNLPSNAADVGSIPEWGTKIPHSPGQLSPRAAAREARVSKRRASLLQLKPNAAKTK